MGSTGNASKWVLAVSNNNVELAEVAKCSIAKNLAACISLRIESGQTDCLKENNL
jgi:hypothetical protein